MRNIGCASITNHASEYVRVCETRTRIYVVLGEKFLGDSRGCKRNVLQLEQEISSFGKQEGILEIQMLNVIN